jgi:hypothetical protein
MQPYIPMPPGTRLKNNRYRIRAFLTAGGFGAIYVTEDTVLSGRLCVLKESFDQTHEGRAQFEIEAATLSTLSHPHLVRVTDNFIEPRQKMYLAMEYIEGEDLEDVLERSPAGLPEKQVLEWIDQILDAVSYCHTFRPKVIHRDIKPANIRLRKSDGKAVLVDFGIAKIGGKTVQTRKAARGYTSGYSPPEQYGTGTDSYSDVYALGATLYHVLTGQIPPDSIDIAHSGAVLVPPRSLNPSISLETERVILTAMQLHPQNRYQTAGRMRRALARTIKVQVPQQNVCAACSAVNKATAKFCFSCGAALPVVLPFDVKQVAAWSAGGAIIGTVLAYLPRLAVSGGTGPVLEAAIYAGALLFGAVGAVTGAFIARKVNLDTPDFPRKAVVTLVTTLSLEVVFGLVLGATLMGGGLGLAAMFLAFLGSVGGAMAGIRLTETEVFRQTKWG